jgi:hypothetical protein
MRATKASGVVPSGSSPAARRRSATSGTWMIFAVSAAMRSTMARGVPAGAARFPQATGL